MTTSTLGLPGLDAVDRSTRQRILRLVVEEGPVSVVELAHDLALSAPGVRRHVAALEESGQIAVHAVAVHGEPRRGRPARRYVATDRGQEALSSGYSDLATQAMAYLSRVLGEPAVHELAAERVAALEDRLLPAMAEAGDDISARVEALAAGLAAEGYAASARPVPGGRAVQLCQGHCPVRDVAAQFPQLCEAETRMFARLLGVHVQRLSTLASGGHVCTTHVPTGQPVTPSAPALVHPAGPASTTTFAPLATDRPAPGTTVEGTR